MPELAFVISPRQPAFLHELVETVAYELELQGIPSSVHDDGFPEPQPGRVYGLVGPLSYLAVEGQDALPEDSVLARTVGIGAEPADRGFGEDELELLGRLGAVFELDVRTVHALHRQGIHARTMRPGYSRMRDHFDAGAARPVDVVFLGAASPRRRAVVAQLAPTLARLDCHIELIDPARPGGGRFGADKYGLLGRAKVVLGIHQGEARYAEWLRMIDAMQCGAVLVTEPSSGLLPFTAGEHLLVAETEALGDVIAAVVRDTALADRIRTAAYERLSGWLPFAMSIAVLRASLVELVGAPIPRDAARGHRHHVPGAWDGWGPAEMPTSPEVRALQRAVGDSSAELGELRHQVAALGRALTGQRTGARTTHASLGWRARTARISALLTLGDDAARVPETLHSLAAEEPGELQIVAVGHGAALTAAGAWSAAHPDVPILTIDHTEAAGLGAARNLALAAARGERCLVLEAGTILYPRAIGVLSPVLRAGSACDVAYPIVVTDAGEPLTSFHAWEPGRLRLGNYIDSPYLARTAMLRTLGGYTEDPRLHGWEDYDLWCRMAEDGYRAKLVAQPLARRPAASVAGRVSLAPASALGLLALAERAPGLLADLTA